MDYFTGAGDYKIHESEHSSAYSSGNSGRNEMDHSSAYCAGDSRWCKVDHSMYYSAGDCRRHEIEHSSVYSAGDSRWHEVDHSMDYSNGDSRRNEEKHSTVYRAGDSKRDELEHNILYKAEGSKRHKGRRWKANSRERSRMHCLNAALDRLRLLMPVDPALYQHGGAHQKLSKIETLKMSINYILTLQTILDLDTELDLHSFWRLLSRGLSPQTSQLVATSLHLYTKSCPEAPLNYQREPSDRRQSWVSRWRQSLQSFSREKEPWRECTREHAQWRREKKEHAQWSASFGQEASYNGLQQSSSGQGVMNNSSYQQLYL